MAKTFTTITQAGKVAPPVAAKSTLINTGKQPLFLTDNESDEAMINLEQEVRDAVLRSLYSVMPGQAISLKAGTYNLNLGDGFTGSAVLFVETSN